MPLAFGLAAFTLPASNFGEQSGFTRVMLPCQFERAPDLCENWDKPRKASNAGNAAGKTIYQGGRRVLRLGKPAS
jgi:hypothetical protein